MVRRIFSSVLLLSIVAIAVCHFGAIGCIWLIFACGILTQLEFYGLLRKIGQTPMVTTGMICGILLMFLAFCNGHSQGKLPSPLEFLLISIVVIVLRALLSHSLEIAKNSIVPTIVGLVYAPLMCCFPIALRHEMLQCYPNGDAYVCVLIWMVLVVKCCDIGGMFVGKYFGKHKLAPNFSPQKTIEGLVGGILASNFAGVALVYACKQWMPQELGLLNSVALATVLAIFSLIGDLAESVVKRLANEKDSGAIFPGIGGIFDLTDSLLFSIPLGVMFIKYFVLRRYLC
ncbi:MAG: phosphatidate cytidylyltransferase [Puniceicoccales bacterium]|jgi:phosphatidate cytidylyltransferase|nr:phosphatidate cytidylyltransferase [Puniceicoccales bacterium]